MNDGISDTDVCAHFIGVATYGDTGSNNTSEAWLHICIDMYYITLPTIALQSYALYFLARY